MNNQEFRDFIREVLKENKKDFYENRIQTLGGDTVTWGSAEHIEDLEVRCNMLKDMAKQQRPRTAAKHNYAAAYRRCKAQLASARRTAEREAKLALQDEEGI